jgi:hypothetical protein
MSSSLEVLVDRWAHRLDDVHVVTAHRASTVVSFPSGNRSIVVSASDSQPWRDGLTKARDYRAGYHAERHRIPPLRMIDGA